MDKRALVESFLASMRDADPNAVTRYTRGDCYQLYLKLKEQFPAAEPWYDQIDGHVLTLLYGRLYDITGWVWSARAAPPHVVPWAEVPHIHKTAPTWRYTG